MTSMLKGKVDVFVVIPTLNPFRLEQNGNQVFVTIHVPSCYEACDQPALAYMQANRRTCVCHQAFASLIGAVRFFTAQVVTNLNIWKTSQGYQLLVCMMSTWDELMSIAITSIPTASMSVDSSDMNISPVPVPKPVGILPAPAQASVVLVMTVVS